MKEYVTSLDVKQDKSFFYTEQDYATSVYKNDRNYNYHFRLYNPSDKEFEKLCKRLDINSNTSFKGANYHNLHYISRVPIVIKIEETYFTKDDRAIQLAQFINNLIQLYEYFHNDFGVPEFLLDGRTILFKENTSWEKLDYSHIHDVDFFTIIKESIVEMEAPSELVCAEASLRNPLNISWKLFLEGIKSFYEGNLRQALVNCTSSIEVEMSQPLYDWFVQRTVRDNKKLIKNLMYDISNPLRFEIYVSTINPEPFKIYTLEEVENICKEFEKLNRIRNKVAHSGYFPNLDETKTALETIGKVLRALWIDGHEYYDELKIR